MFTLIIYSNYDYSDILRIQHDYIKRYNCKKILFIDKINKDNIYSNFNEIYFYDIKLNYSKRILDCLIKSNINTEYVIFVHDNDIILDFNEQYIYNLIDISNKNNIDRIDFNYTEVLDMTNSKNIKFNDYLSLIINNDINQYIYNVNPSLWKLNSFIKLMNNFDYSYRDIENKIVQIYCLNNFIIYKLFSTNKINVGWYAITDLFKFFHITNGGKCLPIDNKCNNLDKIINEEYMYILKTYSFNRPFKLKLF